MGRSEDETDWFGNKRTVHYDDDGNKIGTSETKTDWFGDEYVEHRDLDGQLSGKSETKTDWLGDEYEDHRAADGKRTGTSTTEQDWFGDDYQQHLDSDGTRAGRSTEETDWLGDRYTRHIGRNPYAADRSSMESQERPSSTEGPSGTEPRSQIGQTASAADHSPNFKGNATRPRADSRSGVFLVALIAAIGIGILTIDVSYSPESATPTRPSKPPPALPSFELTSDTITNLSIGLVLSRHPQANLYFDQAVKHCRDLVFSGYDDWRLPTRQEFLSFRMAPRELNLPLHEFFGGDRVCGSHRLHTFLFTSDKDDKNATVLHCRYGQFSAHHLGYVASATCVR